MRVCVCVNDLLLSIDKIGSKIHISSSYIIIKSPYQNIFYTSSRHQDPTFKIELFKGGLYFYCFIYKILFINDIIRN